MILITTAGKVGVEAARVLTAQGEPVRILARNTARMTVPLRTKAGVRAIVANAANRQANSGHQSRPC
jgi:Trk K+ transport system NAD-binding subunit